MFAPEIMSRDIVNVDTSTPESDIAQMLEERGIKRLLVIKDNLLKGIVGRADIIRALASRKPSLDVPSLATDCQIRKQIIEALRRKKLAPVGYVNIIVSEGEVHLWGYTGSESQRRAVAVIAESVLGVHSVINRLGVRKLLAWAE